MSFFNVIIPTYNSASTIIRAVDSIRKQTFKDYTLVIVDDCSTDNTRKVISEQIPEADTIMLTSKRFNGGSRNVGVEESPESDYLLFLDADDEFVDPEFFQKLHDFIVVNNYPEMVRLPYIKSYDESVYNHEKGCDFEERGKGIAEVAASPRVAPWTKALKRSVFVPFPENTLFEDVCQHLKQCDVVKTVAFYPEKVVKWHIHSKSASHSNSPKWQSSAFRFVADLMDLELVHDYTRARRDKKLAGAREGVKNGIAAQ